MSTATINPEPKMKKFFELFAEDLEECNPNAFDLLEEFIEKGEFQIFEDFIWYYLDELEACQPDAFDLIYTICQECNIPI